MKIQESPAICRCLSCMALAAATLLAWAGPPAHAARGKRHPAAAKVSREVAAPIAVDPQAVTRVVPLGRSQEVGSAAWAPDGRQIAFLKASPMTFTRKEPVKVTSEAITGGTFRLGTLVNDLWLAHTDSPATRLLARMERKPPAKAPAEGLNLDDYYRHPMSPSWSPDGKRLAYLSGAAILGRIVLLDVATGQRTPLPYGGWDHGVRWSPDGQWIAFAGTDWQAFPKVDLKEMPLSVARLGSEGCRKIGEKAAGAEWAPDGSCLAYVADTGDVCTVKPDGADRKQLAGDAEPWTEPAWSPDGKSVVYVGGKGTPGLWQVDLATGARERLLSQPVASAQWTGAGIFFVGKQGDTEDLYLLNPANRTTRRLTTAGNVTDAVAPPDGRQVAVVVKRRQPATMVIGRSDLYILTLAP